MSEAFELPDDVVDVDEEKASINCAIFGAGGSGKTVFGGSGKALILVTDREAVPAKRVWGAKAEFKVWDCSTWLKYVAAHKWLKENVSKPGFPFEWVVLDSATHLQRRLQLHILRTEGLKSKKEGRKTPRDPDKLEIQDYQTWYNRFKRYIEELCDLPIDVCFTAIQMDITTEEGDDRILPQLHGQGNAMAEWFVAQMTCIGHISRPVDEETGKRYSRILWEDDKYSVKDQYGTLLPETRNLTLTKLATLARKAV